MNQTAIIFDMDGLMVNTEPLSRRAWQQVLQPYGHQLSDAVYQQIIGRRIDASAQILLEAYPLPFGAEEFVKRKQTLFAAQRAQGVPVMPGLFELHAEIEARGIVWGVATSSSRAHANEILAQLGLADKCHAVAAGDEARLGKPAPDIYLLAAQRLEIVPERCLALEDSVPGCEAAHAAGMLTIAVAGHKAGSKSDGYHMADYRYSSLHEVTANLDWLLT